MQVRKIFSVFALLQAVLFLAVIFKSLSYVDVTGTIVSYERPCEENGNRSSVTIDSGNGPEEFSCGRDLVPLLVQGSRKTFRITSQGVMGMA